jgi:uncharacterized protein YndB with AHSA1/START domain
VIPFETEVRIRRPIEEVFAYLSDPLNLPRWNSAVRAVRKTSTGGQGTYSTERELPTGRAVNELEVEAGAPPTEFAIRTTSGPTPFHYRYRLSTEDGGTVVRLRGEFELEGVAGFVPQLARRAVGNGVDDNLAALREVLEARR